MRPSRRPQTLLVHVLAALRAGQAADFTDRLDEDEIRRRIVPKASADGSGPSPDDGPSNCPGRNRSRNAPSPPAPTKSTLIAGRGQLVELRRAVQPLARKLAIRLAARRRQAARGRIDLCRTLRRSLSTGGVPLHPVHRPRRPARPEIVLQCDVSGSVAGFASFTMLLVQALHDQFSKVRVFAFINCVDEMTQLVAAESADPAELGRRILCEAAVSGWHESSDYSTSLGDSPTVTSTRSARVRPSSSSVGDARTNGWHPNLPALRRTVDSTRRVFWLNPSRCIRAATHADRASSSPGCCRSDAHGRGRPGASHASCLRDS